MKVCIILNGIINDYKQTKSIIDKEAYDCILCADGGANHAYEMDLIPNLILGDLDSIDDNKLDYYTENGVEFEKFPSKKDKTDTELCIYVAVNHLKAKQVDFIAALGGRIDHTIANVKLLYYLKEYNIHSRILSVDEDIYLVENGKEVFYGKQGYTVSILAVRGDAKGVTLRGLEYPLYRYYMRYAVPIGISNVMLKDSFEVEVEEGCLLVVINK